jgi:hypothetical protein
MMYFKINKSKKSGYSVLELIFYIALFVLLSIAVMNAILVMTKSFKETAVYSELLDSGSTMERMSREIKQATGINSISATDLVLNSKDDNDVDITIEFLLSGSNVQLIENGVLTGNLNSSNIVVTSLSFTQIDTVKGSAVKLALSARSSRDSLSRVQDFYDTIVLRGDY